MKRIVCSVTDSDMDIYYGADVKGNDSCVAIRVKSNKQTTIVFPVYTDNTDAAGKYTAVLREFGNDDGGSEVEIHAIKENLKYIIINTIGINIRLTVEDGSIVLGEARKNIHGKILDLTVHGKSALAAVTKAVTPDNHEFYGIPVGDRFIVMEQYKSDIPKTNKFMIIDKSPYIKLRPMPDNIVADLKFDMQPKGYTTVPMIRRVLMGSFYGSTLKDSVSRHEFAIIL